MPSQIANLSNFANQTTGLQLPDGTTATLELIYQGTTERWQMNISYPTLNFIANGLSVCCYPNLLRQWEEVIPFGIACVTLNQTDPFDIDDFASGRAVLYLLTQADIAAINAAIFTGASA